MKLFTPKQNAEIASVPELYLESAFKESELDDMDLFFHGLEKCSQETKQQTGDFWNNRAFSGEFLMTIIDSGYVRKRTCS